ncbi:hypothetical protein Tco_0145961 [Tanacetum coccineum]
MPDTVQCLAPSCGVFRVHLGWGSGRQTSKRHMGCGLTKDGVSVFEMVIENFRRRLRAWLREEVAVEEEF